MVILRSRMSSGLSIACSSSSVEPGFVLLEARLALRGAGHLVDDPLPAAVLVRQTALRLAELLHVLALGAIFGVAVVGEGLHGDLKAPGVGDHFLDGRLVLLHGRADVDSLRRCWHSQTPRRHDDVLEVVDVPAVLEGQPLHGSRLHEVAVLVDNPVGVGRFVVTNECSR